MTAPERHYCTYFDKNYLSRGLTLYASIARHHPSFRLYVGCMDEETHGYLVERALPGLVPIALAELEVADPALLAVKGSRTRVEYYFTSTACWLAYLFAKIPEIDLLTYVDADLQFFSSSEPAWRELGPASIAIVEHRFPPRHQALERNGRFNVGWLCFRRDEEGLAAVARWREQCIEWCYDRLEGDRYGDQKYLDAWPSRYPRLVVLRHRGVNVAPWNLEPEQVTVRDGAVLVEDEPLVCFHFHGLKHVAGPLYESGLRAYGTRMSAIVREQIYRPYLAELTAREAELQRAGVTGGRARSLRSVETPMAALRQRASRLLTIARLVASNTHLIAPRPVAQP